jgi:hypothetical protein
MEQAIAAGSASGPASHTSSGISLTAVREHHRIQILSTRKTRAPVRAVADRWPKKSKSDPNSKMLARPTSGGQGHPGRRLFSTARAMSRPASLSPR